MASGNGLQIVVAGASGYIGRALIPRLLERFPSAEITALSRSKPNLQGHPQVTWKSCDLFSLRSLESALPKKIDLAFYLVHSMSPTAQLDQGSFADYDLILADNFARAIKPLGVRQIIYLGGLIPDEPELSLHLKSRLEIEETFQAHSIPTTVFRAGLILGEEGSSFQILLKLVERLPLMICPKWTQTLTTPVDLETVVQSLVAAALVESHINRVYDLAACRPLSYLEMMRQTAGHLKRRRYFIGVSVFTPTLSRLWVSVITNTPKSLVYPLIESLRHPMVAKQEGLFPLCDSSRSYEDLLSGISFQSRSEYSFFRFQAERKTVRSVQRLSLPSGKTAQWVKERYLEWLPRFLRFLVFVRVQNERVSFSILIPQFRALELRFDPSRSSPDRQLLHIVGGALVGQGNQGRFEFREVLHGRFVLAAIHDYRPALPWYFYKYTQAILHLAVMKAFERHLRSL
ncbi:NAD-dependent epimerase/dehydratase family protein [bacterium]|nr:NAD-dependent epimerase/dehydratase family protein [bacterium]